MEKTIIFNPTKVVFGKDAISQISKRVPNNIKKVLLLYGKGSIKKNGIYNDVINQLKISNIEIYEYFGIKPNPIIEDVNSAIEIIKTNNIDAIFAVGGGSVIDSAKAIACASLYDNDAWDLFNDKLKPKKALPIYTVLTISATGSEMNSFAVVQNDKLKIKGAFQSNFSYPKISFLDPKYTISVPKKQTSFGLSDICSHAMEAFFGEGYSPLSDRFCTSIILETAEIGSKLLNNLSDIDLRTRMMYASTMALNNLTTYGKVSGDWGVHAIGHELSLIYDIPHGASLSIVYPAWIKLQSNKIPDRISELGKLLFNNENIEKTINNIEQIFIDFQCPTKISQLNLKTFNSNIIINQCIKNQSSGYHHKLEENDYIYLLEKMQ